MTTDASVSLEYDVTALVDGETVVLVLDDTTLSSASAVGRGLHSALTCSGWSRHLR